MPWCIVCCHFVDASSNLSGLKKVVACLNETDIYILHLTYVTLNGQQHILNTVIQIEYQTDSNIVNPEIPRWKE